MKPKLRRRPTLEQLHIISLMMDSGIVNGEFIEILEGEERRQARQAAAAFEDWRLSLKEQKRWEREEGAKVC